MYNLTLYDSFIIFIIIYKILKRKIKNDIEKNSREFVGIKLYYQRKIKSYFRFNDSE